MSLLQERNRLTRLLFDVLLTVSCEREALSTCIVSGGSVCRSSVESTFTVRENLNGNSVESTFTVRENLNGK